MRTAVYAAKPGQGTTVAAVLLALEVARQPDGPDRVVLADFAGGIDDLIPPQRSSAGIAEWLAGDRTAAGLDSLVEPLDGRLGLLRSGRGPWPNPEGGAAAVLAGWLAEQHIVIDAGTLAADPHTGGTPAQKLAREIALQAEQRILVTQPCRLALIRAASGAPLPAPDTVVVVSQPDRRLSTEDIERAVGRPIAATIPWSSHIAAAADAGELQAVDLARLTDPAPRMPAEGQCAGE
ncbi:MAG: hypothetical protein F4Z31_04500 [Gemmatimonadetes bacterium]|nr:hypothetical protein [Gemmatimonadota bacterium]MYF07760.1 hypothetical protein [Rhodospirillaceae bacterium]